VPVSVRVAPGGRKGMGVLEVSGRLTVLRPEGRWSGR
jgi:hypothetical protein